MKEVNLNKSKLKQELVWGKKKYGIFDLGLNAIIEHGLSLREAYKKAHKGDIIIKFVGVKND